MLERLDLAGKVVADRDASKRDVAARLFYYAMCGDDRESVVDNDTFVINEHLKINGNFFHKPLETLIIKVFYIT